MEKLLHEWVENGVIDEKTARSILNYQMKKKESSSNKFFLVFSILGALLAGLGIILLVAHNWDNFDKITKSVLALIPVLIGQTACMYSIRKKQESPAWREGSSIFLFLALGAAMALISQIYHLDGNESDFVLSWMLMTLPIMYIMNASFPSLLFLGGITYYGFITGYGNQNDSLFYLYWVLFMASLVYYIRLVRQAPGSFFTFLHHWAIPASLVFNLGSLSTDYGYWLMVSYLALFGIFMQIGKIPFFEKIPFLANGYQCLGWVGSSILMFVLSFEQYWQTQLNDAYADSGFYSSYEFYLAVFLCLVTLVLILKNGLYQNTLVFYGSSLLVLCLFLFKANSITAAIITNIFIFFTGISIIWIGLKSQTLLVLNGGLSLLSILVVLRFFDTNIPFTIRGLLFLAIGLGFFLANYILMKNKRLHE